MENTKEDMVYENKWVFDYDDDDLATMPINVEPSLADSFFSCADFLMQISIMIVYLLNILT